MSKYAALRDYLIGLRRDEVAVPFEELSNVVPGGLPPSAYDYEAWWRDSSANTRHVQASHGWLAAGYHVVGVDLAARRVTFRKVA